MSIIGQQKLPVEWPIFLMLPGLDKEVAEMEQTVAECKAEHEAAMSILTEHKARLKECDKSISDCDQRKEGITRQVAELGISRKKMEHE